MKMGALTKDSKKVSTEKKSATAMDSLQHIISKAVSSGASDIHIEPREMFIWVRYRVGNALQLGTKLPLSAQESLTLSARKLARLDDQNLGTLQDADFDITVNNQEHKIHLSIIPVIGGEKMVLHLSPKSSQFISLTGIGYWGPNLELINIALAQLRGAVVVASTDRNSGSLTLLGIINLMTHPSLKLAAVGEPTVDHVHNANRIKVDPAKGLTPDRSLRLLLKQDPDVIVINDLNDKAAAKTALVAAKKKLICVSILAQDAVSLLQRMSTMDIEPEVLATGMKLAISQTIVRQLCENCREAYRPPASLMKQLDLLIQCYSDEEIHHLEELAVEDGIGTKIPDLSTSPTQIKRLWRASVNGCEHCHFTGYRNYITLNEVINTSAPVIQSSLIKPSVSRTDLQEAALKSKMIPKHIDGLIKCLRGLVSMSDVFEIAKTTGYA